MKRKQVWRYCCEFCKKSGCSASHIARHEKSCTANPDRHCGMCGHSGIDGFIAALGIGDEEGVERLRTVTDGCPACMLAGIRQSKLQSPGGYDEDGPTGFSVPFDFRKEKEAWWAAANERERQREYSHIY